MADYLRRSKWHELFTRRNQRVVCRQQTLRYYTIFREWVWWLYCAYAIHTLPYSRVCARFILSRIIGHSQYPFSSVWIDAYLKFQVRIDCSRGVTNLASSVEGDYKPISATAPDITPSTASNANSNMTKSNGSIIITVDEDINQQSLDNSSQRNVSIIHLFKLYLNSIGIFIFFYLSTTFIFIFQCTKRPNECTKTLAALACLMISAFLNFFLLTVIHDIVPRYL